MSMVELNCLPVGDFPSAINALPNMGNGSGPGILIANLYDS